MHGSVPTRGEGGGWLGCWGWSGIWGCGVESCDECRVRRIEGLCAFTILAMIFTVEATRRRREALMAYGHGAWRPVEAVVLSRA
jgi:hypothetical protein